MRLLKTSLTTSTDAPEYKEFSDKLMPQATADKLVLFDKYGIDALVFPYFPAFEPPIKNPNYTADDPAYVKSDVRRPRWPATARWVSRPWWCRWASVRRVCPWTSRLPLNGVAIRHASSDCFVTNW